MFWIPTYNLRVEGTNPAGNSIWKDFEVLRFGLHCPKPTSTPAVVGLDDAQTHASKAWLPHYRVHSAQWLEVGAWQVYGNFLIHDGPDDPNNEVYASIGCIEICGAPRGFDAFNDFLISLSGPKSTQRADQLAEIGKARSMSITYQHAKRPTVSPAR